MQDATPPRRRRKGDNACGNLARQSGASSRDDAVEYFRRQMNAAVDCPYGCDIVRCRRIAGEQRGDAIALVRFETPVGKPGEIEKMRNLVDRGVGQATAAPEVGKVDAC